MTTATKIERIELCHDSGNYDYAIVSLDDGRWVFAWGNWKIEEGESFVLESMGGEIETDLEELENASTSDRGLSVHDTANQASLAWLECAEALDTSDGDNPEDRGFLASSAMCAVLTGSALGDDLRAETHQPRGRTMVTATHKKSELVVRHDGIRTNATVNYGGRTCSLDAVLEAALQSDAQLAAEYQSILREIADRLYLKIVKERDGSPGAGCCWYAVELTAGINGDTLTGRHRFTARDIRGWNASGAVTAEEETAILRRAAVIGLGNAEYWRGSEKTVARVLNHAT